MKRETLKKSISIVSFCLAVGALTVYFDAQKKASHAPDTKDEPVPIATFREQDYFTVEKPVTFSMHNEVKVHCKKPGAYTIYYQANWSYVAPDRDEALENERNQSWFSKMCMPHFIQTNVALKINEQNGLAVKVGRPFPHALSENSDKDKVARIPLGTFFVTDSPSGSFLTINSNYSNADLKDPYKIVILPPGWNLVQPAKIYVTTNEISKGAFVNASDLKLVPSGQKGVVLPATPNDVAGTEFKVEMGYRAAKKIAKGELIRYSYFDPDSAGIAPTHLVQ